MIHNSHWWTLTVAVFIGYTTLPQCYFAMRIRTTVLLEVKCNQDKLRQHCISLILDIFLIFFFFFFWQTIHHEVREREQLLILYVHAQLLVYERQLQQLVLKFATLSSICSISNTPQTAASKMTKKLNQHLSKTISTKTEHHNSHEVRICCRTVLLDCISFTYTWNIYIYII